MSGSPAAWSTALEALEADVDALEAALRDGRPVAMSTWQPPGELGPVPPALVERAQQLVHRIGEAQRRGQARLEDLQGELGQLDRRREAGAAYSAAGSTGHP